MHIKSALMVHAFCLKAHDTAAVSSVAGGRRTYGVTVAEGAADGRRTITRQA